MAKPYLCRFTRQRSWKRFSRYHVWWGRSKVGWWKLNANSLQKF